MKLTKRTVVAALLLSVTVAGCSDNGSPSTGGESGSNVGGATSGSAGKAGSVAGSAQSGGGRGTAGESNATAGSGQGTFANAAACGERGMAKVSESAYDGTAEFYIIGEGGLGVDVCTIRFDVKRIDAGQAGCTDCTWTHLVEYSNPTVVLDMDGACDASDSVPQLDSSGRAKVDGMRLSRGFSPAAGHGDQLMKYDEAMKQWIAIGRASWSEAASELGYDINTGQCNYGR